MDSSKKIFASKSNSDEPEIILMDQPVSPRSDCHKKIEDLIKEIRKEYTVVIVTHSMQQAARISDFTAFMFMGKMIEFNKTVKKYSRNRTRKKQNDMLPVSSVNWTIQGCVYGTAK